MCACKHITGTAGLQLGVPLRVLGYRLSSHQFIDISPVKRRLVVGNAGAYQVACSFVLQPLRGKVVSVISSYVSVLDQ